MLNAPYVAKLKDYVDPAILDVIQGINQLVFVRRTLWSCAGYGPQPPLMMNWGRDFVSTEVMPNLSTVHGRPYVSIEYRELPAFHYELEALVYVATANANVRLGVNYHLLCPGEQPDQEIKKKWDQIRALLERYLPGATRLSRRV